MATRLTERDLRMLVKCAICRFLSTGQIQRLYFPNATLNAVQKRLRKLSDEGYLRSYREHPTAEAVHGIGPKGKPAVEERGVQAVVGAEVPSQLEHLLGVNDIRIAIETSAVRVAYFFSYWQLSDIGWRFAVIPDAIFALRAPDRRTFAVEYDRGTETFMKLREKLRVYDRGLGAFGFEAVVIVTERNRRLDLLREGVRRTNLSVVVLAATLADASTNGFLSHDFLELTGSGKRKLLAQPEALLD